MNPATLDRIADNAVQIRRTHGEPPHVDGRLADLHRRMAAVEQSIRDGDSPADLARYMADVASVAGLWLDTLDCEPD